MQSAHFELFSVYVGDVFGRYRVVHEREAVSASELADAAGIHERYAREWLGDRQPQDCSKSRRETQTGRSSIEIARAYPKAVVDGIDSDRSSIERARQHLASSVLDDRVRFHVRDAADCGLTGPYDLITIFEARVGRGWVARTFDHDSG